jgi:hypothetical protein
MLVFWQVIQTKRGDNVCACDAHFRINKILGVAMTSEARGDRV